MMGHNSHDTHDETVKKQQFYKLGGELRELLSERASVDADIKDIYKRGELFGISQDALKFAAKISEDKVASEIEKLREKIWVLEMKGLVFGSQLSLFSADAAPAEEVAYKRGYEAGASAKENRNPHDISTKVGQEWQRGFNEGNAFRNQVLRDAVTQDGGSDDQPDFSENDDDGADGEFDEAGQSDEEEGGDSAAGDDPLDIPPHLDRRTKKSAKAA